MLSICSFATGECKDPIKHELEFNTWKECALTALDTSVQYLKLMDENTVNKFELSTQYTCTKKQTI
tara:strand:+ start:1109 stop:1306 length:198 start_codon:yes stop_codon:yes gene_type:complete